MRRWLVVWVTWVLVWSSALPFIGAARAQAGSAKDYYQQGQDAFLRRKLDQAAQDFTQAIQLDPNYIDAYNSRAYAYVSMGKFQEAIADANYVIGLDARNAVAYATRAFAYYGLQDTVQALSDVDYALQLDPNLAIAYNTRGALNLDRSPKQALDDFTRASQLDPTFTGPYLNLGDYYFYDKNYHKAIEYYSQAIQANSLDWRGYYLRGDAYSQLKQYDQAASDYTTVINLQSDSPDVYRYYLNRAIAYIEAGNNQAALSDGWETLRRMGPNRVDQLPLVPGEPVAADLAPQVVYYFPFDAQAGQTVKVQFQRKVRQSVPLGILLDPGGNPVALTQDVLMSASQVTIPDYTLSSTGTYTVVIANVQADAKTVTVQITLGLK